MDADQRIGALALDKVAGALDNGLRAAAGVGRQKLYLPAKYAAFFVELRRRENGAVLAGWPPDRIRALKGNQQPDPDGLTLARRKRFVSARVLRKRKRTPGSLWQTRGGRAAHPYAAGATGQGEIERHGILPFLFFAPPQTHAPQCRIVNVLFSLAPAYAAGQKHYIYSFRLNNC
nr:hypothetical protein SHINE37_120090 [Rhizobiaceae bacterium]